MDLAQLHMASAPRHWSTRPQFCTGSVMTFSAPISPVPVEAVPGYSAPYLVLPVSICPFKAQCQPGGQFSTHKMDYMGQWSSCLNLLTQSPLDSSVLEPEFLVRVSDLHCQPSPAQLLLLSCLPSVNSSRKSSPGCCKITAQDLCSRTAMASYWSSASCIFLPSLWSKTMQFSEPGMISLYVHCQL